jgi:NAD(P)-dependent dehydrogenase (short-subunit alcohol dehydrogenase family)
MTYSIDLSGRVAVVTGSTKGLGRAMVEGLADAGADVVVSSRRQDLCDEVAAEIRAATGRRAVGLACHVGEWEMIPAFIDAVMAEFGRIDILVNNAGINPDPQPVATMEQKLLRKVLAVNFEGPLRTSQLVAPIMRNHGGGSIIQIATTGAYTGGPGVGASGASKAALINLTRTMAKEWAPWGVRVNAISPGPIKSELTEAAERNAPGFYDRASGATALKRVGETAEIVGPVLYLASDASSYVTGEDHLVAGGMMRA